MLRVAEGMATVFLKCTTWCWGTKGQPSISSREGLREESPPHLSPQKEKSSAPARTTTTSPLPLFSAPYDFLMHSLLHFSVILQLLCPADNSIFSHTHTPTHPSALLYCIFTARALPALTLHHNPHPWAPSWALKLVTVWRRQLFHPPSADQLS